MRKVFGIGLGRTGTTSLAGAMTLLGYRSIHCPFSMEAIRRHDAANDITVASRFQELDALYPGSRFILTVREMESWIDSCMYHYHEAYPTRELQMMPKVEQAFLADAEFRIYGCNVGPHISRKDLQEGYRKHTDAVQGYFASRRDCLLITDVVAGDGWEPLCGFLERSVPAVPFPLLNQNPLRRS